MKRFITNPNFWLILGIDMCLLALAQFMAYGLRFDTFRPWALPWMKQSLFLSVPSKILIFFMFHLYSGLWRYTGLRDFIKIIGASVVSTLLIVTFLTYQYRFVQFSRGIFIMDCLLTIFFISGFRLMIRAYYFPDQIRHIFRYRDLYAKDKKRLLIVGAGNGGEKLLLTIFENKSLYAQYVPVAFADDDNNKKGKKVHGVPIDGGLDQLPQIVEKHGAEAIMIAVSQANAQAMRRIFKLCQQTGLPFKIVPSLEEIVLDEGKPAPIREVSYEDLLGREPVTVHDDKVRELIAGKAVLVTGAGGSIGSELCRQICRYKPQRLVMIELNEFNLYRIDLNIRNLFPEVIVLPVIGSVTDQAVVEIVMREHRPSIVFHAAAYKHVPMMELNPLQAAQNNIFGAEVMTRMADKYAVQRFVYISTDKAVRPTSLMGATKRAGELIALARAEKSPTRFIMVRFGNVVGSDGSVAPLFIKQIEEGGPVTVTHPEVTRFFMSIKEAVLLVLQAASMGDGGEVFLLDMGRPIKILTMAEDLIRLANKRPYVDIDIMFTGLRPGEKLYEELLVDGESSLPTSHPKVFKAKGASVDSSALLQGMNDLRTAIEHQDVPQLTNVLKKLIDDYKPSDFLHGKPLEMRRRPKLRAI